MNLSFPTNTFLSRTGFRPSELPDLGFITPAERTVLEELEADSTVPSVQGRVPRLPSRSLSKKIHWWCVCMGVGGNLGFWILFRPPRHAHLRGDQARVTCALTPGAVGLETVSTISIRTHQGKQSGSKEGNSRGKRLLSPAWTWLPLQGYLHPDQDTLYSPVISLGSVQSLNLV